ncbi:MAG: rod shape-determining protein MreD [Chloroflexi bacterium]|nr:rod shape-determining protein MreD [Chloroflexota bacterium]MDL1885247.1 rod shape-determining protein MreD [Anaerolineae bacterium CFX8]
MGNYLSLPVLAIAAILQSGLTPRFSILGGRPDLVFLLVLSWALNAPLEQGVVWAFVGGILLDLMSAAPLGTSVIGMIIIVFVLDIFRQQIYRVGVGTIMWTVLAGTLFQQATVMVLLLLAGFKVPILDNVGYVVLPSVFYNFVLIFPVYFFMRRLQKRVIGRERFFS